MMEFVENAIKISEKPMVALAKFCHGESPGLALLIDGLAWVLPKIWDG